MKNRNEMAKEKKQGEATVADLRQDERNYRKHSEENKKRIKKSIDECGLGRSVVVDADGVLVAGNGVQSVLPEDTPIRIVETDGTELVVVKRTDLHEGDERRKKLALADNATSDNVEWDFDAMAADGWDEEAVAEFGVAWPELDYKGEYEKKKGEEDIYDQPLQLIPSKEYILVIVEKEDFDEAREHFGCGFVRMNNLRSNKNIVKSRTVNYRDYVSRNSK